MKLKFGLEIDEQRILLDLKRNKVNFFFRFYLKIRKPRWLNKFIPITEKGNFRKFYGLYDNQELLFTKGKVIWGYVVNSNISLNKKGKGDHPGIIVYSLDHRIDVYPQKLINISYKLLNLKEDDQEEELKDFAIEFKDEYKIEIKKPIPRRLTGNMDYYYSTTMIIRKHLPGKYLKTRFVPILVLPDELEYCLILPSKFWTKGFKKLWNNTIEANKINNEGLKLYKKENFYEARKKFQKAKELYPLYFTFYDNIALCQFHLSNLESARTEYNLALELNPFSLYSLEGIGQILEKEEKYEESELYYKKAIELNPTHASIYIHYLNVLKYLEKHDIIITTISDIFKKQEKISKENQSIFYNFWAVALSEKKQFKLAFEKFEKALKYDPTKTLIKSNYAFALFESGNNERSLLIFEQILKDYPTNIFILNVYTDICTRLNKIPNVIQMCEYIHYREPKFWYVYLPWLNALNLTGKPKESIIIAQKFLKLSPNIDKKVHAKFLNVYGEAYFQLEEFESSFQLFKQAIELDEEYYCSYENLGILLSILNKGDESNHYFEKAIQLLTKDNNKKEMLNVYSTWINSLYAGNKFVGVDDIARKMIDLDPMCFLAYNFLGLVELRRNNLENASSYFKQSFKLEPTFSIGYANYIYSEGLQGRFKVISEIYNKTKELQLHDARIEKFYGLALAKMNQFENAKEFFLKAVEEDNSSLKIHLLLIECLIELKEYNEALIKIEDANNLFPDDADILLNWGEVLLNLHDFHNSRIKFEKALQINPKLAYTFDNIVALSQENKNYKEALVYYNDTLEIDPLNPFKFIFIGITNLHLGNFENSKDYFDRAIGLFPKYVWAYVEYGLLAEFLGEFEVAVDNFTKVIELEPTVGEHYNLLGVVKLKLQLYDEAKDLFLKTIELDPYSDVAYLNMGNLLFFLEIIEDSERYFQKAIELGPENAKNYYYYGLALFELERYHEANEKFTKAVTIDGKLWEAYYYIGVISLNLDQFDEAIIKFTKSIEINPKHTLSYYYWSIALEKLEKIEESKEKLDKAIDLNPEFQNLLKKPETPWYLYE